VGLETTAASESAFLCSLAVVVVPLLDLCVGKKLSRKQAAGIVMALVGVAALELDGFGVTAGNGFHHMEVSTGDVASLLQPLAFGVGFWRMERAMQQYPNQAMRASASQLLAVFLASAAYSHWTDPSALEWHRVREWVSDPWISMALVWTGVVTTGFTVALETVALETLSAAETTLIFSTEPLWGTACAAAVMGEQLGLDAAVGAVLIVSGCVFSNLGLDGIKSFLLSSNSNNDGTGTKRVKGSPTAASSPSLTFLGSVPNFATALNELSASALVSAAQIQHHEIMHNVLPWICR